MEIKLTADKKLLEALDKLAEALTRAFPPAQLATHTTEPATPANLDPVTALPAVPEEEPTQTERPAEAPSEPAQSVPSREAVQRVAIVKIQGGKGKQVKALIEKHDGTRVGDVPEENLAAFLAELEALA